MCHVGADCWCAPRKYDTHDLARALYWSRELFSLHTSEIDHVDTGIFGEKSDCLQSKLNYERKYRGI